MKRTHNIIHGIMAAVLTLFMSLAGTTTHAALVAYGPPVPGTQGFPAWYQDPIGLSLGPCWDVNEFCQIPPPFCYPSLGPDCVGTPINLDPAVPIDSTNFPLETIYFSATSLFNFGPELKAKFYEIISLEGSFSGLPPTVESGQQITFARIYTRVMGTLTPNARYTVIDPYITYMFDTDANGTPVQVGGAGVFRTLDGCIGPPCDFNILLSAATTHLGPWLVDAAGFHTDSATGNVYIGPGPLSAVSVVNGPNGNVVTITGPNAGGLGLATITSDAFFLTGKVVGVSASPNPVVFPPRSGGVSSAPITVTVKNPSMINGAVLGTAVKTGVDAADFSITSDACSGATLTAGGWTCTFTVSFSESADGTRSAAVTYPITSPPGKPPLSVNLSGTVDNTPPVVVFTYPADGAAFTSHNVISEITATFSEPILATSLTMTTFTLRGSNGMWAGPVMYIAGNKTAIFVPTPPLLSAGTYTATITTGVADLAGNNLAQDKVWQFVIAAPPAPHITVTDSISPVDDHQVPFGSVSQGNPSDEPVTITNSGNADLTIGTITSEHPFTSAFSIVADPCSGKTLAPTDKCSLTIRFTPSAAGTFTDTFDIPSNDANALLVTVGVSGTGTPMPIPDIVVTDSVFPEGDLIVPFGSITQGVISPVQTINVYNAGTASLLISSIQLTGTDPNQFSLNVRGGTTPCGAAQPAMVAGKNCTVTVTFSPLSAGAKSANVVITSSDPDEASVSVALTGTGLPASTNNPPTAPKLVYPANGQAGLATSFACRWKKSQDPEGDAVTYRVYYCTDQNFSNCTPETAANRVTHNVIYAYIGMPGLLLLGAIFAVPLSGRKKFLLLMISILMIGGALVSCGGGGGGGAAVSAAPDEASHQMSGLKSATTYYWKVVADDGKGGLAESATWSFSTQ